MPRQRHAAKVLRWRMHKAGDLSQRTGSRVASTHIPAFDFVLTIPASKMRTAKIKDFAVLWGFPQISFDYTVVKNDLESFRPILRPTEYSLTIDMAVNATLASTNENKVLW
jgi:hypothetical protein